MDQPVEAIAKRIEWETGSRKSIEVRVVQEIVPRVVDRLRPPAYDRVEDRYIETAEGGRYRETLYVASATGEPVLREQRYFRAGRAADVLYGEKQVERQTHVVIKRWFGGENQSELTERPTPLRFDYVGWKLLARALPEGEVVRHGRHLGRETTTVRFPGVKWPVVQDLVYSLDDRTGIPLSVVSFRDEASRAKDRPLWAWSAEELASVDGHDFVRGSSQIDYAPDGSKEFTRIFRVESIAFDRTYPESTFWPTFQPGVKVLDVIENREYNMPGKLPEAKESQKHGGALGPGSRSSEAIAAHPPLVANPPGDWISTLSTAGLWLGLAVMVGGVFLHFGRMSRQSSAIDDLRAR